MRNSTAARRKEKPAQADSAALGILREENAEGSKPTTVSDDGRGRLEAVVRSAHHYLDGGISIIPIRADGGKQPTCKWKAFQSVPPTHEELAGLFGTELVGIAAVGGRVSGGLECIDFDQQELFGTFCELVEHESPGLVARLTQNETPRPGRHLVYRCQTVEGNQKLAQRKHFVDGPDDVLIDGKRYKPQQGPDGRWFVVVTLIETRGEGGYFLLPGCPPEAHETGRLYRHVAGPDVTQATVISPEERATLLNAARMLNEYQPEDGPAPTRHNGSSAAHHDNELSPGDDFAAKTEWGEILKPHGWSEVGRAGELRLWRRPGKARGHSATTGCRGASGGELFCCFSSNAHPFQGANGKSSCTSYSKFAAHAVLNHGGDFRAAARELKARGFGTNAQRHPGPARAKPGGHRSVKLPYRPFPLSALPEPARSLVRQGAKSMGCDPAYLAVPLLPTLAASIGATRRVLLKPGWTEPSVLWSIVIGKSGTTKSPAWLLATSPFKELEEQSLEELPNLMRQHEQDKLIYEADKVAWQKQGRAKGEPPPVKPEEPHVARRVVSDITVEALADRLSYSPRGLLVLVDEAAAWLASFDAYRQGRGGDLPKWLSMYRAESLLVDRKSGSQKTLCIRRAAVSVTGTITPAAFIRAMRGEYEENGLLARLLLGAPPAQPKAWTDAVVNDATRAKVCEVVARLASLDFARDAEGRPEPVDLRLDREAFGVWVEFYNRHALRQVDADAVHAATLAKLEGGAARLALVHHLVRQAAGEPVSERIDATSMTAGIELAEWFAHEVERVLSTFGETDADRERRELEEWIERHGGQATARDVSRGPRQYRGDAEAAEAALSDLVQCGRGVWEPVAPTSLGGRPSRVFRLARAGDGDETPETFTETGVSSPSPLSPDGDNGATQPSPVEDADDWGVIE